MKNLLYLALFVCLTPVFSGCMAMHERRAIREEPSPNPITPRVWSRIAGTYIGPIRSTNKRFGTEGWITTTIRLEIAGTADDPMIFLKTVTASTSAWNSYIERSESFTNIPERSYGVKGFVLASSHEPNQLYLRLEPQLLSPTFGAFLIVTFLERGGATVDFVEHAGRRGEGMLQRLPHLSGAHRE